MDRKATFLNSLSDEQLGIFHAHEFNANLDDVLQDYITPIQYELFTDWKKNEAANQSTANTLLVDSAKMDNLLSKMDTLTFLLTSLTKRVDEIESKLVSDLSQIKSEQLIMTSELKKIVLQHEDREAHTCERFTTIKETISEIQDQTSELCVNLLPTFDSESLCEKWMHNLKKQLEDNNIVIGKKEKIGNKENIEKIFTLMKKFKENQEVENVGIEILNMIAGISCLTSTNIVKSEHFEYLKTIFMANWSTRNTKITIMTNVMNVYRNISRFTENDKLLLVDSNFELFLLPFSASDFSELNLLAGNVIYNLLCVPNSKWKTKMEREVENALLTNMASWQLGKLNAQHGSLGWALSSISIATKSRQRYAAWTLANQLMIVPEQWTETLKTAGAVLKIETVLAVSTITPEVRRLLQISLDILKK